MKKKTNDSNVFCLNSLCSSFKVRVNERKIEKKEQNEVESCETKTSKASRCMTNSIYKKKQINQVLISCVEREIELCSLVRKREREEFTRV